MQLSSRRALASTQRILQPFTGLPWKNFSGVGQKLPAHEVRSPAPMVRRALTVDDSGLDHVNDAVLQHADVLQRVAVHDNEVG